MISCKLLLKGIIKNIPGIEKIINFHRSTGDTDNARYCYSVWLRHLCFAYKNGLKTFPSTIAELGPGDSLGIGIAALICGANKYYALDVVKYWDKKRNIKIFEDLVELFNKMEDIPGPDEFPKTKPELENYNFPEHILSKNYLKKMLNPKRINNIRNALINFNNSDDKEIIVKYFIPWNNNDVIIPESVDMIYSQAVLEHVNNLDDAYNCLSIWLKPNGIMSHTIDFKSHGTAEKWNGHWTYSNFEWKLIKGKKKFLLNRAPHSLHVQLLDKYGFKIICDTKTILKSDIQKKQLASKFKNIPDDDLMTSGCFIQATKK